MRRFLSIFVAVLVSVSLVFVTNVNAKDDASKGAVKAKVTKVKTVKVKETTNGKKVIKTRVVKKKVTPKLKKSSAKKIEKKVGHKVVLKGKKVLTEK
jgi:hypothetical protein